MLIGRTIESSQCGPPWCHRIRVITGEALKGESTRGGQFHVKLSLIQKHGAPPKIKSQVNLFSAPIGLTWDQDILVLKPSPYLHNGNKVDGWMGLDE
ncbi:hypothetical protein TNCV_2760721 [Trichonephila clavipes]|nr:hypothetical protein TNCV_2760721 [Trichonephila clavipes]